MGVILKMKRRYKASLKYGSVYTLPTKNLEFKKGEPVEVSEEIMQYLKTNAVNNVTVSEGDTVTSESRQKFTFELIQEAEPVAVSRRRVAEKKPKSQDDDGLQEFGDLDGEDLPEEEV